MQRHLIEYIVTLLGESPNKIYSEQNDKDAPQYTTDLAHNIKNFIDEIPGGFFIYNATGDQKLIYANKAMLRIFGCDTLEEFKELTDYSFKGIVHPDDLEAVEASIWKQISGSQDDLDYVEYRIIRKDGEVRWVEDYGHYLHNDVLGDIFYVFITDANDKLAIARAEKALADKEQLRRLEVIEGLSIDYESIFYADIKNNVVKPYRLNSRTQTLFEGNNERRYTAFAQDYVKCWVHPDDRNTVKTCLAVKTINKRLAEESTFYQNFRMVLLNGDILHKQLRIVSVNKDHTQIVIGLKNVDEELRLEMQQKQILESALENSHRAAEAKNIFLANMSHDLRTPLNAISGYVALAKNNISDNPIVNGYLQKIEESGEEILEITEKILQLTYIESQSNIVDENECNVLSIVNDVYTALQAKATKKNITFSHDCSAVTDANIVVDGEKLKQILYQLADNAIKYTKSGDSVNMIVTECEQLPNGFTNYKFTIVDTGKGISKEALPRIFDAFEREQNTTGSGVLGTGIGLTLAKKYTELLGGTITAESEVGKGSTFTVTIGCKVQSANSETFDVEEMLEEIKQRKILIVEDNMINLEIETEMLEELGFSTDSAENGKVAVDKITSNPEDYYAVILMDIQMPVMDGRQATETIRKLNNPTLARIPIIAVSANAFDSDKKLSERAGIDAHLAKPLDINLLLETMSNIVFIRKHNPHF